MKTKIKWLTGLGLVGLALYGLGSYRRTPEPISPEKYKQILDEICSVDVWMGYPTPDASSSVLAYTTGTDFSRRIELLDLKTLERRELPTTNEAAQIYGWSPDGRYLTFVQQVPFRPDQLNKFIESRKQTLFESWLTIYDRQTDSIRRITQDTNVMETPFFWLPNGSFLFVSRKLTNDYGEMFLGNIGETNKEKIYHFEPDFAVISDKMAAYAIRSELFTLEVKPLKRTEKGWDNKSYTVRQISNFKSNGFNGLVWLRYCPVNSNFLFCSRPAKSNWRYLYQYDPQSQSLTQLSHEDTYNGQWLLGGNGFAYVINTNNGFQLAIRTKEPAGNTNLFAMGSVSTYKADPLGDRVYALASLGVEPRGIWEYTVTNQRLRQVATVMSNDFAASQIVQPEEFKIKSFDGLEVPCFLFPPVKVANRAKTKEVGLLGRLVPKIKYPLVMYVPPTTAQFQRTFDVQSQVFANTGFYFAAINFRGCDGYGKDYSSLANTTNAAKDVLALYQELIKNPNIDKGRVFLSTSSSGALVVFELLATAPKIWGGAAFDKPGYCPINELLIPSKLPPLLMIMGEQDSEIDSMKNFASWAMANRVNIKTVLHANAGHITYNVNDRKDSQRQMVEFFLGDIK